MLSAALFRTASVMDGSASSAQDELLLESIEIMQNQATHYGFSSEVSFNYRCRNENLRDQLGELGFWRGLL